MYLSTYVSDFSDVTKDKYNFFHFVQSLFGLIKYTIFEYHNDNRIIGFRKTSPMMNDEWQIGRWVGGIPTCTRVLGHVRVRNVFLFLLYKYKTDVLLLLLLLHDGYYNRTPC